MFTNTCETLQEYIVFKNQLLRNIALVRDNAITNLY